MQRNDLNFFNPKQKLWIGTLGRICAALRDEKRKARYVFRAQMQLSKIKYDVQCYKI